MSLLGPQYQNLNEIESRITNTKYNVMKAYSNLPDLKGKSSTNNFGVQLGCSKQSSVPLNFNYSKCQETYSTMKNMKKGSRATPVAINNEKSRPSDLKDSNFRRSSECNQKRAPSTTQSIKKDASSKKYESTKEIYNRHFEKKNLNKHKVELESIQKQQIKLMNTENKSINNNFGSSISEIVQNLSKTKYNENYPKKNLNSAKNDENTATTTTLPDINSSVGAQKSIIVTEKI